MTEDEGTWKNRRKRRKLEKEKDQQTEQRKSWRDGKKTEQKHTVNQTILTLKHEHVNREKARL